MYVEYRGLARQSSPAGLCGAQVGCSASPDPRRMSPCLMVEPRANGAFVNPGVVYGLDVAILLASVVLR